MAVLTGRRPVDFAVDEPTARVPLTDPRSYSNLNTYRGPANELYSEGVPLGYPTNRIPKDMMDPKQIFQQNKGKYRNLQMVALGGSLLAGSGVLGAEAGAAGTATPTATGAGTGGSWASTAASGAGTGTGAGTVATAGTTGTATGWKGILEQIAPAVGSSLIASKGARDATKKAAKGSEREIEFLRESRDLAREDYRPYREAGTGALGQLVDMTTNPDYDITTSPGYQFRLGEGMRALERSAGARGGLMSGGFARKALRYGQDYASQEFTNIYNRIANIAGLGQVATQGSAGAALTAGQGMGRAASERGVSSAYGSMAGSNVWSNLVNELGQIDWDSIFNRNT